MFNEKAKEVLQCLNQRAGKRKDVYIETLLIDYGIYSRRVIRDAGVRIDLINDTLLVEGTGEWDTFKVAFGQDNLDIEYGLAGFGGFEVMEIEMKNDYIRVRIVIDFSERD